MFELAPAEIAALAAASESDWQYIGPTIFGTLFERALDESQRAQLGAHYTSPDDIRALIEACRAAVRDRHGVELRDEIAYLGEFPVQSEVSRVHPAD